METAEAIDGQELLGNDSVDTARFARGQNPDFIANQWKPGQSGYTGGRRSGPSLTTMLRWAIEAEIKVRRRGRNCWETKTGGQWIVERLFAAAVKGDMRAMTIIFDRLDGAKPIAQIFNQNVNAVGSFNLTPETSEKLREGYQKLVESRKALPEAAPA